MQFFCLRGQVYGFPSLHVSYTWVITFRFYLLVGLMGGEGGVIGTLKLPWWIFHLFFGLPWFLDVSYNQSNQFSCFLIRLSYFDHYNHPTIVLRKNKEHFPSDRSKIFPKRGIDLKSIIRTMVKDWFLPSACMIAMCVRRVAASRYILLHVGHGLGSWKASFRWYCSVKQMKKLILEIKYFSFLFT